MAKCEKTTVNSAPLTIGVTSSTLSVNVNVNVSIARGGSVLSRMALLLFDFVHCSSQYQYFPMSKSSSFS